MMLSEILSGYQFEAVNVLANGFYALGDALQRPSVVWRPRLYRDGDQWCALYGENLQDGCAGFGDTPEEAMAAFDAEWRGTNPKEPA